MIFSTIYKQAGALIQENSTAILTGVGVIGTVATAVLASRASFKASEIIIGKERVIHLGEKGELVRVEDTELTTTDKMKLTWPLYLPAIGTGVTTVTAIIYANRISSRRAVALAAAYGLSEKSFSEYKEKAIQHLGIKKETALVNEVAQDRVNLNPQGQTIIIGDGEVLCYDAPTGRYFKSDVERIRAAENTVNFEILHNHGASLSSFYEEIGLPPTTYSDDVGWNMDNLIGLTMNSVLTDESKPCLVIDFKVAPITGYGKLNY